MPKSLGGILMFVVMATITVVVGQFVYSRFVSPAIANLRKVATP